MMIKYCCDKCMTEIEDNSFSILKGVLLADIEYTVNMTFTKTPLSHSDEKIRQSVKIYEMLCSHCNKIQFEGKPDE